jgi:hypothetical protein
MIELYVTGPASMGKTTCVKTVLEIIRDKKIETKTQIIDTDIIGYEIDDWYNDIAVVEAMSSSRLTSYVLVGCSANFNRILELSEKSIIMMEDLNVYLDRIKKKSADNRFHRWLLNNGETSYNEWRAKAIHYSLDCFTFQECIEEILHSIKPKNCL